MCLCCHLCVVQIPSACVGVLTWAFTRQGHISVSHVFHNFWLYFLRQGLLLDLEVSSSAILTALQAAESSCPYSHSHDFSAWSPQPACVTSVLKNLNSDLHDCTGPVWITEPAPNPSRITFRRWKHRLAFWIPTSTLTLTWKKGYQHMIIHRRFYTDVSLQEDLSEILTNMLLSQTWGWRSESG